MRIQSKLIIAASLVLILATLLTGCSLYRPNLRQGNYISQEELDTYLGLYNTANISQQGEQC